MVKDRKVGFGTRSLVARVVRRFGHLELWFLVGRLISLGRWQPYAGLVGGLRGVLLVGGGH